MVEMNIYSRGTCTCRSSNEQFQRNNSSNGSGSNEIASCSTTTKLILHVHRKYCVKCHIKKYIFHLKS